MSKEELWTQTLHLLLENVDADNPKSVFLNLLQPFGIFGDQFVLLAENAQVESWVKKNYIDEMEQVLSSVSGTQYQIGISSKSSIEGSPTAATATPSIQTSIPTEQTQTPVQSFNQPLDTFAAVQPTQQVEQPDWMNSYVQRSDLPTAQTNTNIPSSKYSSHMQEAEEFNEAVISKEHALFTKCTFDTFVVGKSNEFARGAALAVAEQPGTAYNPLFIYGNSGLGKTHLLVAIANYVLQNYPAMKTRYVSANNFLNDYVEATRSNQWGSFNEKYHQADILLVDDVQYLEGKDETVNQLFSIFNEMTNQNKQIVLSADRAPKDIDMDDRMRSRFVSGLLADVKPPDYETRLAILKNYLTRVDQSTSFYATVPDEVLSYLAKTSTSNIREMEGAITRLVSHITLGKKTNISVEETKEILKDFFPDTVNKQVTIDTIQTEVENFFDISHEDIVSSKRSKSITTPRHIAIYLSRYMTEESLESIGKKFGGRDHTTIMHSVNKIERDQKDNRLLFDQIEKLTIRIKERS